MSKVNKLDNIATEFGEIMIMARMFLVIVPIILIAMVAGYESKRVVGIIGILIGFAIPLLTPSRIYLKMLGWGGEWFLFRLVFIALLDLPVFYYSQNVIKPMFDFEFMNQLNFMQQDVYNFFVGCLMVTHFLCNALIGVIVKKWTDWLREDNRSPFQSMTQIEVTD